MYNDPEHGSGQVTVTKSKDLKGVALEFNITGTDKISYSYTQTEELTETVEFTLLEGIEDGEYTVTISCGDAEPQVVTISATVPEEPVITVDPNSLSLTYGDPQTASGTITVTKTDNLIGTNLTVAITGTNYISYSYTPTQTNTETVEFTLAEGITAGTYSATISCGDAEPQVVTIAVTIPPKIHVSTQSISMDILDSNTLLNTVNVTLDSPLSIDNLTVDWVGAGGESDYLTATVDTTNSTVTFSGQFRTFAGTYVARLSCGSAIPVDVTITVTAPASTSLTCNPSGNFSLALDGHRLIQFTRVPDRSQGVITYDIEHPDQFNLEFTPYDWNNNQRRYNGKLKVTRIASDINGAILKIYLDGVLQKEYIISFS